MNDSIVISGIRAIGFHGVFDYERRDGQEFVVDVVLTVDLHKAVISDDLADTLDYGVIAERVVAQIQGEPCNLIEKVAGQIADDLLAWDQRITALSVTVHKPSAPVSVPFSDIAVTIQRSR